MQAPSQQQLPPSLSATLRQLPHNLPSPDSDQDSTSMVILPSSPSSAFVNSPSITTTTTTHDTDSQQPTPMIVPAKRGYKSHVPSACVNCKKAHLACDVSRPCKRCVSSGKASTCQDVQHKKRGRPKLNDTKRLNIMYGGSMIIQTPASIMQKNTPSTTFSFVHEPLESFRGQQQEITWNKDDLILTPRKDQHESSPMPSTSPQQPSPQQQQQQQPSSSFSSPALSFVTTSSSPAIPSSSSSSSPPTITMFLSMEMCCARASEEIKESWGYDPNELMHRSLYGLISSHDTDRLARLHRLLLDNIMDITRQYGKEFRPDARPPPSERTTSPLFHQIEPEKLMVPARGSEMFMDTIHVKKQSGDYELYQMQVSLGAGLGADLTKPSTLNKLYIVAELRKHEYRVRAPYQLDQVVINNRDNNNNNNNNNNRQRVNNNRRPLSKFQPFPSNSSNHISNNVSHSSYHRPLLPRTITSHPSRSGPLQVRQGLLPGHFTTNSQLNTVTLSAKKLDAMPKVNIAPMSTDKRYQPMDNKVADRLFPSLSGSFIRQKASHDDTTRRQSGATGRNGTSSTTPIHVSPGLSYRIPPNSAGGSNTPTIPPRRVVPSVTHPTTQYFLQTSSSTLNAAASAAQRTMKQTSIPELESSTAAAAVGKTDSNRKTEMSVRSLLC
ncbi:hypothetical protein K492DRAFT_206263 [Lichtheimia hyalospora FSU 10163]|nr:hypothetical protein K492DRAFT_206263 [Lichtheimia hyalospora FSU 10163]